MKVTKRNGNIVYYDDEKVEKSILKANRGTVGEPMTEKTAAYISGVVFGRLAEEEEIISSRDVRACVVKVLNELRYPETAARYDAYKKAKYQ